MKEEGAKSNEPVLSRIQDQNDKAGTPRKLNNNPSTETAYTKSRKLIIIISISVGGVIILAVILLSVLLTRKKDNKNENDDEFPHNITGLYKFKKGEEGIIFNPSRVGLTDDQYKIEFLSGDEKSRRFLEEIEIVDGRFISTEDALIKIVIKIKINLTSLDFLFQGSENLINVDFSNLNMEGITNMMYLFAGCTNLEKVDFSNLDTSNVKYMEFIFGLCSNLQTINGIEFFNTTSLKNAAGMFYSCGSLPTLNLSSFDFKNVESQQGVFAKTDSLQILDIRTLNNTDKLFGSPDTTKNHLKIILNEDVDKSGLEKYDNFEMITNLSIEVNVTIQCIPSKDSNCLSCGLDNSTNDTNSTENINGTNSLENLKNINITNNFVCYECKYGYYLPSSEEFGRLNCKKCDEGCENCIAGWNESYCLSCKIGYNISKYGKCQKDCARTNCSKCKYDEDGAYCDSCPDGYTIVGRNCYINCDTIKKEGCEECYDKDTTTPPKCTKCQNGYYLPTSYSDKCSKCSIEGCKTCTGESEFTNSCLECKDNENPPRENNKIVTCYDNCERGTGEKCKSCSSTSGKCGSCNDGYVLSDGTCNYCAFTAVYETTKPNEEVELFLPIPIGKMKINGNEIEKPSNKYKFEKAGSYEVCIKFDTVPMISNLFANNQHVVSIVFSPTFDTSKLIFVNGAFQNCPKLKYIDFSKLDLRSTHCIHYWFQYDVSLKDVRFPTDYKITPYYLDYTFYGCTSLTSIDLSSFELSEVYFMESMFEGCTNLKYIDIRNFDHPEKTYEVRDMFKGVPNDVTVIKGESCPMSISNEIPKKSTS